MVMNLWQHREVGNRRWWHRLIVTLYALLLGAVFLDGGCVAMVTGHAGSCEAGLTIGGVLASLWPSPRTGNRSISACACQNRGNGYGPEVIGHATGMRPQAGIVVTPLELAN